jgi:hypothetical protein
VSQGLGVGQIVDSDKFDIRPMQTCPDDVPADAAKAVDRYFYWHFGKLYLLSQKWGINSTE